MWVVVEVFVFMTIYIIELLNILLAQTELANYEPWSWGLNFNVCDL